MVKPRIWSGLEKQVHDALTKHIDLLEELLASGEGVYTEEEYREWREQLRHKRRELQELIERAGRGR